MMVRCGGETVKLGVCALCKLSMVTMKGGHEGDDLTLSVPPLHEIVPSLTTIREEPGLISTKEAQATVPSDLP